MFFNKKKITERAPRGNCSFEFTDKFCRNIKPEDYEGSKTLSDKLCKNLRLSISSIGNHSYSYQSEKISKVIGSVYQISIKDARKIAQNLNENKDEFLKAAKSIKLSMYAYFQKFGAYPHKPKGTEVIISDENVSLKEKIKELQAENENLLSLVKTLKEVNTQLVSRMDSIRKLVNYDEDDTQIAD
jgi:hypothetical protein